MEWRLRITVSSTCEVFRTHVSNQQIEYAILLPRQGVNMYFDRDKVHVSLYNLLNNAFKIYSIRWKHNRFCRYDKSKDGLICIRIEDTEKE